MTNSEIIDKLDEAVALMDLLEVNPFKVRAFQSLSIQVDKLERPLRLYSTAEIEAGFSKAMAKNIQELLATETFTELLELESQVPVGVRAMLTISGIGPKKVKVLWKEAGIETITALKEACISGQVAQLKGFGGKTQNTILEGLDFLETIQGKLLMHKADRLAEDLAKLLSAAGVQGFQPVGDCKMRSEVVSAIEYLVPIDQKSKVEEWTSQQAEFQVSQELSGPFRLETLYLPKDITVRFFFSGQDDWVKKSFMLNTQDDHWQSAHYAGIKLYSSWKKGGYKSEEELYENAGGKFVQEDLRTGLWEFGERSEELKSNLVQYSDLKGCIHNHSTYSDGKNTLLEMAQWCIDQGWEYFGIADHSPTAVYANGLIEDRVIQQWREIDEINQKLAPFKILKGTESDILTNGDLDFSDEILRGFDYVVASVHSVLKMDIDLATARLIKAIENPYTTILGHCSGRILLKRSGYPLHYQKIIDACIANGVVIEMNAHPSRLDMDWRNLNQALEKGALISINPDAHEREGMDLMRYGTWMARKAGATKDKVLNAMSLAEIEMYLKTRKSSR